MSEKVWEGPGPDDEFEPAEFEFPMMGTVSMEQIGACSVTVAAAILGVVGLALFLMLLVVLAGGHRDVSRWYRDQEGA